MHQRPFRHYRWADDDSDRRVPSLSVRAGGMRGSVDQLDLRRDGWTLDVGSSAWRRSSQRTEQMGSRHRHKGLNFKGPAREGSLGRGSHGGRPALGRRTEAKGKEHCRRLQA